MTYVVLALLCLFTSSAARAEPTATAPSAVLAYEPGHVLVQPSANEWPRRHRARLLLGVAIGIVISAPLHVAWAARDRTCGYGVERNASLYGAAALGGIGAGLVVTSGVLLARSRRRAPLLRATSRESGAVGWATFGTAIATQVLLGLVRLGQSPQCST